MLSSSSHQQVRLAKVSMQAKNLSWKLHVKEGSVAVLRPTYCFVNLSSGQILLTENMRNSNAQSFAGRQGASIFNPPSQIPPRSNVSACAKICLVIATFDLENLCTCGYVFLRARTEKFSLHFKKVHWR